MTAKTIPAELEAACQELLGMYAEPASALIPMLLLGHQQWGHIPHEFVDHVAAVAGVAPARVHGICSFYPQFAAAPGARHVIAVCRGLTCRLMGAETVAALLTERLGIAVGQTRADGVVALVEVDCLGACATAPAIRVDGVLYDSLTEARLDEILADLT